MFLSTLSSSITPTKKTRAPAGLIQQVQDIRSRSRRASQTFRTIKVEVRGIEISYARAQLIHLPRKIKAEVEEKKNDSRPQSFQRGRHQNQQSW